MTEFALAHPYLFTFIIGFISLALASAMATRTKNEVHYHHHYDEKGEKQQ